MTVPAVLAAALLVSCTSREPGKDPAAGQGTVAPPVDSLVIIMPDSAEVWYTGSILDSAASGETCSERSVEIRRGGTSILVPLLYTRGALEMVNDTTVRASLIRDCAPVDRYLINTRTGQPRREE